jgi:hypothetical protein
MALSTTTLLYSDWRQPLLGKLQWGKGTGILLFDMYGRVRITGDIYSLPPKLDFAFRKISEGRWYRRPDLNRHAVKGIAPLLKAESDVSVLYLVPEAGLEPARF